MASPGLAKTSAFLLSTGTLMIGPSAKVMELTPDLHSVGLVKNLVTNSDPQFTELMQGIDNQLVYSVNTNNQVRVSCEVYEHTRRNIAYGIGLDASGIAYDESVQVATLASPATVGSTFTVGTGDGADFTAGDWVVIQQDDGDKIHVGKVASVAADVVTMASGFAIPTGVTYATGSKVYIQKAMDLGASATMPALGAKIVGLLPQGNKPVAIVFPKIRITKGFALSFQNDNFANLPFEFVPYSPLPSDAYYSDFKGKQAKVLI